MSDENERSGASDGSVADIIGRLLAALQPTLTDAEREAVERAAQWMVQLAQDRGEIQSAGYLVDDAATLRGLLSRMGDCPTPDNAADRNNGATGSE